MESPRLIKAIYTDGACSGNPGPGGWGVAIYFDDGAVHELGGADSQTTNNRMELQAAIAALEFLEQSQYAQNARLYTDSEYVKNGITKWIRGWKKRGWKTASGSAVLNQDLWKILDKLNTQLDKQLSAPLQWQYVRGHAGNEGNERCDAIARAFSNGQTPALNTVPDLNFASSPDKDSQIRSDTTAKEQAKPVQLQSIPSLAEEKAANAEMSDSPATGTADLLDELPREIRVAQLRNLIETLRIADEVASQGYLISSSELADLMDINASAVTSRGDRWTWRNWIVSRVRREGNQILWQLERVEA